jgi:2-methylcitrate dehydratase
MVAVPLIFGRLAASDYEDAVAADPRIDALRAKMEVKENSGFTRDYFNPDKRAIANAVQVFFENGERTERVVVEYPIGHRRRRAEGLPLLKDKFRRAIATRLSPRRCEQIIDLCEDQERLETTPVHQFMELWIV